MIMSDMYRNMDVVSHSYWFRGVMVSTLDFESSNLSSNLGET